MQNFLPFISLSFVFLISNSTIETLGGFFLIEAKDMNEAVQVASRWPSARLGSIEVRPVDDGLREDKRYA